LTQGVCDGCILQAFDQTGKKPLKATKGKDGYPAFGKAFRTGWSVVKEEEPWAQCPNCDEIYTEDELEELDAYFEEREMGSQCFNCGYHAGRFTGRFNYE